MGAAGGGWVPLGVDGCGWRWMGAAGGAWGAIANPHPDVGHTCSSSLPPNQLRLPVGGGCHGSSLQQTLPGVSHRRIETLLHRLFYFQSKTCKITLSLLGKGCLRNFPASSGEPGAGRRGRLPLCARKSPPGVPGRSFAASWFRNRDKSLGFSAPVSCPVPEGGFVPSQGIVFAPGGNREMLGAPGSASGWHFRQPDAGCGANPTSWGRAGILVYWAIKPERQARGGRGSPCTILQSSSSHGQIHHRPKNPRSGLRFHSCVERGEPG